MPEYLYKAKKGPAEVIEGSLQAASVDDAVDKLDQMGLLAIRLDEIKPNSKEAKKAEQNRDEKPETRRAQSKQAAKPRAANAPLVLFARVTSSEITLFGRQLASLIKSGVPILRALWIIQEQTQNPPFRKFLEHAQIEINNGRALSAVLSDHPKYFSPLYVAMVRMGEDSGNLQEAMLRISDYRQRQEEIFSRVRTAMAYPALMGATGIGTIVFMLTFVIPKLTKLFSSLGTSLPVPTRILMSVSDVFQKPVLWVSLGAALLTVILLVRWQAERVRILWSIVSLKLPIIKGFTVKSELARFSRTFELLIQSGLPILRAIETAVPVLSNRVFRRELEKAREALTGGGSLGQSLRESGVFPLFMTNLISVSEESGKLDEAMKEIAQFYERETDEQIRIMTSLMEPLMILVMGLIVGFIVMAMMLPMFELNMIVK